MKYIAYTIITFLLCLIQVSLFSNFSFFSTYIYVVYVILFSYYMTRQSSLAMFLVFIGGIFLDLLNLTTVGITSANFFISLLVFTLLERFFPNERFGRLISIFVSVLVFFMTSFITLQFLAGKNAAGIITILPRILTNTISIYLVTLLIEAIRPTKKDTKIKIA